MISVSVLVPFRASDRWRERNWAWVRRRWNELHPEWQVVEGKDVDEPFSRAGAINNAAARACGDVFVIADADVAVEPEVVTAAVHELRHGVSVPWRTRRSLSASATSALVRRQPTVHFRDPDAARALAGSGNVVVSRRAFAAVSGFDERFRGWGYEDVSFVVSVDTLVGFAHFGEHELWHLWHPWRPDGWERRNAALLARYRTAAGSPSAMSELIDERVANPATSTS